MEIVFFFFFANISCDITYFFPLGMDKNKTILLSGQSSTSRRNIPAISEADSSPVETSTFQLEAILSSSETYDDCEVDSTDASSSYESSSSEEAMVEKFKRKLSMYQAMLDKKQAEQKPESAKKKKAENRPDDIYSRQLVLNHSINIIENSFQRAMDEAKLQGYAYGIILEDGSVISRSSPSLHKWWEETVRFEQNGPAAVDRYYTDNQLNFEQNKDTETPRQTYDILMELSDATLGSVLSALMNRCDPPQRKFPFEKKALPPWWPTGNEPWWDQITIEKDQELPPYKKPHDLRKIWKAAVVIAIIKHMAPAFGKLARVVKQSKNLQGRMTVREMHAWNYVLKKEAKMYSRDHPDVPVSDLLGLLLNQGSVLSDSSNSNGMHDEVEGFPSQLLELSIVTQQQEPSVPPPPQQQQQQQQQHQVASMLSLPTELRMLCYTCDHPRCLHHDNQFGFRTAELRDQHLNSCGFRNAGDQFRTPDEFPIFPTSTLYQAPSSSSQQMAPLPFQPPMVLQPPSVTVYQEVAGAFSEMGPLQQTWSFNNAGVPGYPAIPNDGQDMGHFPSAILGHGFFNGEGNGGNAGLFM